MNLNTVQVGSYVMKKNFTTFGRDEDSVPVLRVESAIPLTGRKGGFTGNLLINGFFNMKSGDLHILTEESALKVLSIWESCSQLSKVTNDNPNTGCSREDNGQPKVTYPGRLGFRRPLFAFRMKFPDKGFQAYECLECGKIHIGKTQTVEALKNEKVHLTTRLKLFSNSELINAVEDQESWRSGSVKGHPWEVFNNATRIIFDEYHSLETETSGISEWFASYNLICQELALRITNSRRHIEHLL